MSDDYIVSVDNITRTKIFLSFQSRKGKHEFVYDRETTKLSRCTCEHGSLWRGNKKELCYHATLTANYIKTELNKEVIP